MERKFSTVRFIALIAILLTIHVIGTGSVAAFNATNGIADNLVLDQIGTPAVNAFTRQNPATSPTNADNLVFRVVFNKDVQNVDSTDFAVNGTTTAGVTGVVGVGGTWSFCANEGGFCSFTGTRYVRYGALGTYSSITGPFTNGVSCTNAVFGDPIFGIAKVCEILSAATFDITVSGGNLATFNGTVGLNLAAGQNITDGVGNPLPNSEPATDETYTLDNSAPSLSTFARRTPATSPTNADTLTFRATFSEALQNLDASDFAVSGTTAAVTTVTPVSATVYDLTVSGGDLAGLDGTVGLNLAAGQNITDLAGTPLPNSEPATDETYTLDNSAPSLSAFARRTPATSPTNADTLTFRATFSEALQNLDASDFAVSGTTAAVTTVTPVSATVYDLTVSGGDLAGLDGTVGLNLAAGQNITDLAGTPLPNSEPATDETYTLDNTAPEAPTVTAPADSAVVNSATPTVSGTAEANSTVTIIIDGSEVGTATADGTGAWSYIVPSALSEGSHTISATAADVVGNLSSATPKITFTVDITAPTVTVEQAVGQADPTPQSPVRFTVTFSEDVSDFTLADLAIGGTAGSTIGQITGGPQTYSVAVSGMTAPGTVTLSIPADAVVDAAGNGNTSSTSSDNTVEFDPTTPVVTGVGLVDPSPTRANSLRFNVTFVEVVSGVDASDFILFTDGVSGARITVVTGSGGAWTVTVDSGTGSGTLRLDVIDDDTIVDGAGNTLGGAGVGNGNFSDGEIYVIDRTAPTAGAPVATAPAQGDPALRFTVIYSDNLALDSASLGDNDLTVSGPGGFNVGATLVNVTPGGNGASQSATYEFVAPGGAWGPEDAGDYLVSLAADTVLDTVGNPVAAADLGRITISFTRSIYLPLIGRAPDPQAPDLRVETISLTGGELSVTIVNTGNVPVTGAFWVDLYLNPSQAPTAPNQIWQFQGRNGAVWAVTGGGLPLEAGERLTLRLGDTFYVAAESAMPARLVAGDRIYVQVDSAAQGSNFGAILELDELPGGGPYNNIANFTVSAAANLDGGGLAELTPPHEMPARPR